MNKPLLIGAAVAHLLCSTTAGAELLTRLLPGQVPPAGGDASSYSPIISPDGRYVVFASAAQNLVPDPAGSEAPRSFRIPVQVYMRDRTTGDALLVSARPDGLPGDGDSYPVAISADGNLVLYQTYASDLFLNDSNDASDVLLRDVRAGTNMLVSVSRTGQAASSDSFDPSMTEDGRFVTFTSDADDVVSGDSNEIADVFIRDMQTGQTMLASVGAESPGSAFSGSDYGQASSDGRFVAFYSTARNLVPNATAAGHIFLRDLQAGSTVWASAGAAAALYSVERQSNVVCHDYVISRDGSQLIYVAARPDAMKGLLLRYDASLRSTEILATNAVVDAFVSMTPDARLVAFVAETNSHTATPSRIVLVHDTRGQTTTLASADMAGQVSPDTISEWPAIDWTGKRVAFVSNHTGLVTNRLNGAYNIYLRDLELNSTVLVNVAPSGEASGVTPLSAPSLSTNGSVVVFETDDGSLVAHDTNEEFDVFARDLAVERTELVSSHHAAMPSVTPEAMSSLGRLGLSANGRFLAFTTDSPQYDPGQDNQQDDVVLMDLVTGATTLVSITPGRMSGNGPSSEPSVSEEGRFVAFTSLANDLAGSDTNFISDIFLRDVVAGTTSLISVNKDGTGAGDGASSSPVVSSDGRYVVFSSLARNLTTNAAGSLSGMGLFVRDTLAGNTTLVRKGSLNTTVLYTVTPDARFIAYKEPTSPSTTPSPIHVWDVRAGAVIYTNYGLASTPSISPDGTHLAGWFGAPAKLTIVDRANGTANVLAETNRPVATREVARFSDNNRFMVYVAEPTRKSQLYMYDSQTGQSRLISRTPAGNAGNDRSDLPEISSDGRFIMFRSFASDLVAGDELLTPDIYLYNVATNTLSLISASLNTGGPANERSGTPVMSRSGDFGLFESWASDLVRDDRNGSMDLFLYPLPGAPERLRAEVHMVSNGNLRQPAITWRWQQGKTYGVEYKDSLTDPEWKPLNVVPTQTGDLSTVVDSSTPTEQRFYRVVSR